MEDIAPQGKHLLFLIREVIKPSSLLRKLFNQKKVEECLRATEEKLGGKHGGNSIGYLICRYSCSFKNVCLIETRQVLRIILGSPRQRQYIYTAKVWCVKCKLCKKNDWENGDKPTEELKLYGLNL